MRIFTGFFLISTFIILFSFSFIGVTNEVSEVETIDNMLDKNITIDDFSLNSNSYMYDANGEVISEVYGAENRIYIPFANIPNDFIHAMVATEDRHFYSHNGFDMTGITRALFVNADTERIEQGGSTITQQLVKNLFLDNERTYNRKLTEILYAYQFEKVFSKEKVLELYANTIYFQNGVYGIEAASKFYFSQSVNTLTLGEIAFLSAIPNRPSFFNPLRYPENTNERKNWILTKMHEMNFINEEQYTAAIGEEIQLNVSKKVDLFPDYVTYIHYELEQLIGEKEGFNKNITNATSQGEKENYLRMRSQRVEELFSNGVHIYTAFQPEKQELIYRTAAQHLPEPEIQGVAVMIDHDRYIVALSGGKAFQKFNFHRGYQAFRQPGSAIKPLLVFAPYLAEKNISISNIISAAPFCKNGYCPQNFGGAVYGSTTIETAFKHSYNTTAVRMMDQIGIVSAFSYFEKLGFSNIVHEDYRLPAALGGLTYGVSPLEMTAAYATFANDGKFQKARAITEVVDSDGNLLFQWDDEEIQVWDQETNTAMRTLLNKVITEGTGRRASINGSYIGGKTGTTNDFNDLWFIGLNEHFTTGVWVGHDKPKSLEKINSRSPHLLIWRDLMND